VIRAVFLDIDNTLTSSITRTIPKSALTAIARAREKGILVFAATGRNTRAAEEGRILESVALDGYIAVNGQLCYLPDGSLVHRLPLDPRDVAAAERFCKRRNIPMIVSEQEENYITHIDERVLAFHEALKIPLCEQRTVENLPGRVVLALSPFMEEETERQLLLELAHSEVVRFNPINCDVIPKGGGKDVGMEKMAAHFGIPLKECLAMGDGGNDIAMLRAAGVGVAMAGSGEDVLRAADWIAPAPDEDGLLETFCRFGIL